jgi:hypothetical protein
MKEMGMFLRKLLYFLLFKREAFLKEQRELLFLKEINFPGTISFIRLSLNFY